MSEIDEDTEVYRVIMDGYILADTSKFQVIRKLKRLFGTSEQKILEMIDGQPTIIKHQLPKRKAYQYVRTITNAGAACHTVEPEMKFPVAIQALPNGSSGNGYRQATVYADVANVADVGPLKGRAKRYFDRNVK